MQEFRDGDLYIDYEGVRVLLDDKEVSIPPTRYRALVYLTQHAGKVCAPGYLIDYIWQQGGQPKEVSILRWHISHLRKDLGDSPPARIIHIRGFGYRYTRLFPNSVEDSPLDVALSHVHEYQFAGTCFALSQPQAYRQHYFCQFCLETTHIPLVGALSAQTVSKLIVFPCNL